MSMTIGRCSLTEDPDGDSIELSGDVWTFTLREPASSVNDCKAKMQQLSGLVGNKDEPVIPLTWTEDPTFDGFYYVRGVRLSPFPVYLSTGFFEVAVTLQRVGGYGRPQFESIVQSVVRTNSHGVVAPSGLQAAWYSSALLETDLDINTFPWAGEDGNVRYSLAAAPLAARSVLWATPPSEYYKNSAKIEVSYDSGTTWYAMVGQQIPSATGVYWRISNGLARTSPLTGVGYMVTESYTDGTWKSQISGGLNTNFAITTADGGFPIVADFAGTSSVPAIPRVIRNTPEMVTIRTRQVGVERGAVADWSIRRGDHWIEVAITQPSGATTHKWGLNPVNSVPAGTAFTGGTRGTTTDANGRRWWVACTVANAAIAPYAGPNINTAASTARFAFSADYVPGTFTDTGVRDRYFAARSERVRVVAR
jgi:hypothetical protein